MTDLNRLQAALGSHHWRFFMPEAGPEQQRPSLLHVLTEKLAHIPRESWPERIAWGGLYINGRAAKIDSLQLPLPAPCKLEYYEPKTTLDAAAALFPQFSSYWIVYEDEHLIACCKPAGLPSLPAREQQHHNLKVYLERYCGQSIHMPSRLDMSTSGLIVVSKALATHAKLQRIFETRQVQKTYRFLTSSEVPWKSLSLQAAIGRDRTHPILRKVSSSGSAAETSFRLLERRTHSCLIEACPKTGRTHQIRVHAAALGCPIRGDNFYGGAESEGLHLFSYALELPQPITRQKLQLEVPAALVPCWAQVSP
jgi:23S rRNA pseudouridine1911/1915/1917 synthase